MKIDDWLALLWNSDQDSFHVLTVKEMLATNRLLFMEQKDERFVVLGVERTRESLDELQRQYMPVRDARQRRRSGGK